MIIDLEQNGWSAECPTLRIGGEPVAILRDPQTGRIEVLAAWHDTHAVRNKAQMLLHEQLIEGREFAQDLTLQGLLCLGFVYCSREYGEAHRQELKGALRQGRLLRTQLRREREKRSYGKLERKVEHAS